MIGMFAKLQKKIIMTIVGATGLFVLLISIVTAFVISQNYINTFSKSVNETVQIAIDYSTIKLSSMMADSEKLAVESTIVSGLSQSGYVTTINPKLNFFRSRYQEEVSGVALYALNGQIYRTDSLPIADIVPWNELLLLPEIVSFTEHDDSSALVFLPSRTTPDSIRSLAILTKVEANDVVKGYLLIDIDTAYLFNKYFAYRNIHDFVLINNFIVIGSKIYDPSENDQGDEGLSEYDPDGDDNGYFSKDNHQFLVKKSLYQDQYAIITIVDTAPLVSDVWIVIGILSFISTIFLIGSAFIARKESGSIVKRLTKLQMRMKQATDLID